MALDGVGKPGIVPPVITIAGDPGAGKTTLGALFPLPLFIQAEEISSVFDTWPEELKPDCMPPIKDSNKALKHSPRAMLKQQLDQIGREPAGSLPYATLVIDSASSWNAMIEQELCDDENKLTVAACAGGFNRGYNVIAAWHQEMFGIAKRVARKHNMALVFLSHTGIRKQKLKPDADEHTVWDLMMCDAAAEVYRRLSDAVLFLKSEEYVRGVEKDDKKGTTTRAGKVIQTGKRFLVTGSQGHQGFTNAKNRMDLDAKIPVNMGENPLLELIPYFAMQNA